MGRLLIMIGALAVGGVAIYFAIQELGDNPEVEAGQEEADRGGRLRGSLVRITDEGFKPRSISLRGGQTVRWVNADDSPHTVEKLSGPGRNFDSGALEPDETYERGFVNAGIFRYEDARNPDAPAGKVRVLTE